MFFVTVLLVVVEMLFKQGFALKKIPEIIF
jgi:hypothetical protein